MGRARGSAPRQLLQNLTNPFRRGVRRTGRDPPPPAHLRTEARVGLSVTVRHVTLALPLARPDPTLTRSHVGPRAPHVNVRPDGAPTPIYWPEQRRRALSILQHTQTHITVGCSDHALSLLLTRIESFQDLGPVDTSTSMAHDLCDDLELVGVADCGYDDYLDDFHFHDGFPSPPATASGAASGRQQHEQLGDTSALDYKEGKDMQGIPWERLNYTRDQYRQMRLKEYKSYKNLTRSLSGLEQECKQVGRKDTFYDFHLNTRAVKSTIVHFQLRNLVWPISKHDVYLVQNYSVVHWSALLQRGTEVLNVAGRLVPTQNVKGARPLSRVQISTMAVKDNLMVAGGFQGELICKYVDKPGVAFCTNLAGDDHSTTNAVEIYQAPNGGTRVMAANNDCVVRTFDAERYSLLTQFTFPWSVNSTSVTPYGKLLAVVGDSTECVIADPESGRAVATLRGHQDYSFSSAWHPGGGPGVLATGNQDGTCRLWDARRLAEPFAVLAGRIGAVRGLRFSPDGRFLAAAEAADFVHVYEYDGAAGYVGAEQEVALFGEVAGAAFSPDGEALFVGVADRTYGGLLEFRRRRADGYLDSCFF